MYESLRPSQKQDRTPFTKEAPPVDFLPKHKISEGKLSTIEGRSDIIVRKISSEEIRDCYEQYGVDDPQNITTRTLEAIASRNRKMYDDLYQRYGIKSQVMYVISKDKDGPIAFYALTNKVDGQMLKNTDTDPETSEKVEAIYTGLARYYADKLREGGPYLMDISQPEQYVHGTDVRTGENGIFLVDIDPLVYNEVISVKFINTLDYLLRYMKVMENKFGRRFEPAREIIRHTVNEFLSMNGLIHGQILSAERLLALEADTDGEIHTEHTEKDKQQDKLQKMTAAFRKLFQV